MIMNFNVVDIERGAKWSGRGCCALGVSTRCQVACARASDNAPLALNCRQSDEIDFFGCLARHEVSNNT